jgi:hypothetical protein
LIICVTLLIVLLLDYLCDIADRIVT